MADGGTHLDPETLAALAAVPKAFAAILRPGIAHGAFRDMHPLAAYVTTIAPILMFVASSPVRTQIVSRQLVQLPGPPLAMDTFLADLTTSLQRAFAAAPVRQRRS